MSTSRDNPERNEIVCTACGTRWTGLSRAHCKAPGCHRTFSSVSAFDLHRDHYPERGRCIDPATLYNRKTGKALLEYRNGLWSHPQMSDTDFLARQSN